MIAVSTGQIAPGGKTEDQVANVHGPELSVQARMEGLLGVDAFGQSKPGGVSPDPALKRADKPRIMEGNDFSKAIQVLLYAPV